MRWVYVNGALVESEAARVSASERGLLYGYGVFETMRSYGGRVFRLEAHYRRLREGAELLGMAVPLSLADLEGAVDVVLGRNKCHDAFLRLTVGAGPPGEGAAPADGPAVVLQARPPSGYPPRLYERGMTAVTSEVRRNETSPLSRVKSLNYLDSLLTREDARRRGADEAVMLNTRGLLAEGSASNVFLVRDGRLATPGVESGALPGVTRRAVLELAGGAGLTAVEAEVEPGALEGASEVFLTNSLMEVMPLTRLDGRPLGTGRPGPVTEEMRRLYREAVFGETGVA